MDPAIIGHMRIGYFRIGVFDPQFDEVLTQREAQPARHLGDCAPAVFGPGGGRFAGTLASGETLHCRFNVKIPLFDQMRRRKETK